MFAALLDTSVLWPSLQRDFLLSLAIEGLYRPLWSSAVLEELQFHEARKLIDRGCDPDEAARQSRRLIGRMSTAFEDSRVDNWELLDGTFGLPDQDDEHVVAAALVGGAQVIVTSNLKDFPAQRIPTPLRVMSPAQFAADTVSVSPAVARHAVTTMLSRFMTPPLTFEQFVDRLVTRYDMTEAAELIRGTI